MMKTTGARACGMCATALPTTATKRQRWCTTRCRQTAYRARKRGQVKVCGSCKRQRLTSAYGKDSRRSDGLEPRCRECRAAKLRARYVPTPRQPKPLPEPGPTKVCPSCKVDKPREDYQRNRSNRDGLQARCRECQNAKLSSTYQECHAEMLAGRAAWRATDEGREMVWAQGAETRARSFGAPVVERVHRLEVFARDAWLCTLCGEPMRRETGQHPLSATVDHTVPLAEGGSHTLDNCASAHRKCNRAKHDDPLPEHWRRMWASVDAEGLSLGRAILWTLLEPEEVTTDV